jgi:hypothetical protein
MGVGASVVKSRRVLRARRCKRFRFAVSHISRKTSEIWGTRDLWKVKSSGRWRVLEGGGF